MYGVKIFHLRNTSRIESMQHYIGTTTSKDLADAMEASAQSGWMQGTQRRMQEQL